MTPKEAAGLILRCCPEWSVDSIQYLAEGDFCSAYVVNDEWVFRFGKHDQARESLRREYCLLPKIEDHITLKIPSPKIASLDEQGRLLFIGYPLLPGPALSQKRYLSLDEASRTRCAGQVGVFLTQMQSVDLESARACGVPVIDYAERYACVLSQAREKLYPSLDEPECLFIERVISSYLESGDAAAFRPSLLHGDFGPDHVLFDEANTSVSAIIDFGDMVIGDPVWDLNIIYEDYGLDFLSRLLNAYNASDRASLLGRVYQYYLIEAIDWAVGRRSGPEAEFAETIAQLRVMRIQEEPLRKDMLYACGVE